MAQDNLSKFIGMKLTLTGIAKESKAGPVLITDDNIPIYIKSISSWSERFLNKQVSLTGILKKEKLIPDPTIDENGAISQGAEGDQLVLENAEVIRYSRD